MREPCQVANFDETGFTPGRDLCGARNHRVVTIARVRAALPKPQFRYLRRITVLAAVLAEGPTVAPAAVFKGEQEPHLTSDTSCELVSRVCTFPWTAFWRKEVASVNTQLFRRWIRIFAPLVRAKVQHDQWVVVFYDAFQAHMAGDVMDFLAEQKIAVMALPAHTSDRLQPLDASVFSPFRQRTNTSIDTFMRRSASLRITRKLGRLDVWDCIDAGYKKAFTVENIKPSFRKSGLWPVDAGIVCENGIWSSTNCSKRVSAEVFKVDLRHYLLEFRRHGLPLPQIQSGFIKTKTGIELTRDDVRKELRHIEISRKRRDLERHHLEANKFAEDLQLREQKRERREQIGCAKAWGRVARHGIRFSLPRSLQERRRVARQNAIVRRVELS